MLSKRFPFAVYYEIVSEVARVVAVLDMRQDPKSIRRSLDGRKANKTASTTRKTRGVD
jgi:hypothetical protein